MSTLDEQEQELSRSERRWERQKALVLRKYQLKQDKKKIRKMCGLQLTTTKLYLMFLFINCTAVELFTGYITLQSFKLARELCIAPELTPLVTLIGAVVSEVIGFAVYMLKSMKENSAGGVVYETAMANIK